MLWLSQVYEGLKIADLLEQHVRLAPGCQIVNSTWPLAFNSNGNRQL